MTTPNLRASAPWLSAGLLLTFCSGFGQTYFVAVFAGEWQSAFHLSNGAFGLLYTVATLASAAALARVGKLADRVPIRWLGAGVFAGLAAAALLTALAPSVFWLGISLFALRLFGQGMCTHTAMTAMGRWFNRQRGRAVAIAAIGMPASQALMPPLAAAGLAAIGWRATWTWSALLLAAIGIPLLLVLLRHERHPTRGPATNVDDDAGQRHWTRGEVLRSGLFYALLPAVLAPPFVITAIFFNQVTLVELRGWQLAWFTGWFPLLAAVYVVASLLAGEVLDRIGAGRLLPWFLLPLGIASALLGAIPAALVVPVAVAAIGLTQGFASAMLGALWPEIFGTRHLGSIRSLVASAVVLASAIAPGLSGVLLDAGVGLDTQLLAMAAYCVAVSAGMHAVTPRIDGLRQPV